MIRIKRSLVNLCVKVEAKIYIYVSVCRQVLITIHYCGVPFFSVTNSTFTRFYKLLCVN